MLIYLDIGMDARNQLLAPLSLAPIQCFAWGHPVTTRLDSIDYFLTSELMEPTDGDDYIATAARLGGDTAWRAEMTTEFAQRHRLAPIQCFAWGHPVTTRLDSIDYFLTSELMEPTDGDDYIATAARLGGDTAWRAEMTTEFAQRKWRIYDDRAAIMELEDFIVRTRRAADASLPAAS